MVVERRRRRRRRRDANNFATRSEVYSFFLFLLVSHSYSLVCSNKHNTRPWCDVEFLCYKEEDKFSSPAPSFGSDSYVSVWAHRCLLSARCVYFHTMFASGSFSCLRLLFYLLSDSDLCDDWVLYLSTGMKESSNSRVQIPIYGCQPDAFRCLIGWIYSGAFFCCSFLSRLCLSQQRLNFYMRLFNDNNEHLRIYIYMIGKLRGLNGSNCLEILICAHQYQMSAVKQMCQDFIENAIDDSNVFNLLEISERFHFLKLRQVN